MQKVTYTNALGNSIVLRDYVIGSTEYKMQRLFITPLELESISRRGYKQDGSDLDYSRAVDRPIELSGLITGSGSADIQEKSRAIKAIFNPTIRENTLGVTQETGTLIYENDYWSKQIKVKVQTEPVISYDKTQNSTVFSVYMIAHFPFFSDLDADETTIDVSGVEGGFYWTAPTYFSGSFYFGEITGTTDTATNNGDIPAPVTLEWTGEATNPRITLTYTKTTQTSIGTTTENIEEYVQLNKVLASNEKAIVTTGYNDKNAYIQNTSTGVITKDNSIVTADSTYFQLPLGTSNLAFSADSGASGASVDVKYKQQWTGV